MSFREVTYRDRERLNQDAKELVSEFVGSATLDYCCCDNPPCVIDVDEVDRGDNADINAGSPVTWSGDTGSFTVSSGALITSSSNVTLQAAGCDRVRCRVFRTGSTSGSAEARVGMYHSGLKYGYVRWPATGGTPVLGIVGGTYAAEIDAPLLVSTTSTVLSLCVKEMQGPDPDPTHGVTPFLGLYLYSETGNYKVFTHINNDTWDPDTTPFGSYGFIGTGTVNSGSVGFVGYQSEHQSGDHGTAWDECKVCEPCPCLVCQDSQLTRTAGEPITTLQCGWQVQAGSWGSGFYSGNWGITFDAYALIAASSVMATDLLCQGMATSNGMLTTGMHAVSDNRTCFRLAATNTDNASTPSGLVAEYEGGAGYGTQISASKMYVGGSLVASCQASGATTDDVGAIIYMGDGYVASEFTFSGGGYFILILNTNTGTVFSPGFGTGADPAAGGVEYYNATVNRTQSDFWPYCDSPTLSCVIFVALNIYYDNRNLTNQSKVLRVLSGTVRATGLGTTPTLGGIEFDAPGAAEYLIPHPTLSGGGIATCFVSITNVGTGTDTYPNYSPVEDIDVSITFGDGCRVQVEFGNYNDFTEQPRYPLIDPGISSYSYQWYRLHLWVSGAEVAVSPWLIYDASYPTPSVGNEGAVSVWFHVCIGDGAIVVYPRRTVVASLQYAVIHYNISGPPYPGSGYWGFQVDNLPANLRALGVVDTLAYDNSSITDPRFDGLDVPTCYSCVDTLPCLGICTPNPPMPYMIKATISGIAQGTGAGDVGSPASGYSCLSGECDDLNLVVYLFRECFSAPVSGAPEGCSSTCSYIALLPPYTRRAGNYVTCDGWVDYVRATLNLDGGSGLPYWTFQMIGSYNSYPTAGTATGSTDASLCTGPTSVTLPVDATVLASYNDGGTGSIYCDFTNYEVQLEFFYW